MKTALPTVLTLEELYEVAKRVTDSEMNGVSLVLDEHNEVLAKAKLTKAMFVDGVLLFCEKDDIRHDVDEKAIEALEKHLGKVETTSTKLMTKALKAGLSPIEVVNQLTPLSTKAVNLRDEIKRLQDPDVEDVIHKTVAELYGKESLELGIDAVRVRQNVRHIKAKFGVEELVLLPTTASEDSRFADFLQDYVNAVPVAKYNEEAKSLEVVAVMHKASSLSIQCKRLGAGIVGYADQANNGVNGTSKIDLTQVKEVAVADELIVEDGLRKKD
jgi:hypothetical protein